MTQDYRIVGPSAQTLFLGCSIAEITMNLAWGSENSSCDIKLVKDYVAHETDTNYNPLHTSLSTLVNGTNPLNPNIDALSQEFSKPIAKFETDKLSNHNTNDRTSLDISIRDNGKKLWNPHRPNNTPRHWKDADPGFMGEQYSIMGAPCQVRFQDISFAGFITRWTYENALYSVNLAGPGSLLKGVKLILSDYYGTVSSTVGDLALPYIDPNENLPFNSNLRLGNIPNLINVFGFLEKNSFGSSKLSEFGMKASVVFNVISELLSGPVRANSFSPYGAIVSRGPMSLVRNLLVPQTETILDSRNESFNLTDFGLLQTRLSNDQNHRCLYRLDLSQVPVPSETLYLPLSPSISLDEFITFCCAGAGFDWNAELVPDGEDSGYTGTIKINTYSRRIQPPPKILKTYIESFISPSSNMVSYDTGEEYKSDSNVRKVIIGGKQERLYQVTSHTLSRYKNSKIYNPVNNVWMDVNLNLNTSNLTSSEGNANNTIRIPLGSSQRMNTAVFPARSRTIGAGATAQTSYRTDTIIGNLGLGPSITRGNYETSTPKLASINDPLGGVLGGGISGGAAYPIHLDLISPYFGRGFDGNIRKAFYDRKRRQLLINCPLADLYRIVPVLSISPGFITISENEIRAALSSFDSWLAYLFEGTKFGVWKPMSRLIYEIIKDICGSDIANNLRLFGPGVLKNVGKVSNPFGTYHTGNPISTSQVILYSNVIMPILQGLYNYVTSELGQHYGKNYLVRVPSIQRAVGDDGVARYDWEITESGWEEFDNYLDNTINIGSLNGDLLATENGKFGPIIGWNNSKEKDYSWPPIGNINGFVRSLTSPMRGVLKGLALSASGKTDNSNFTYFPLNTNSDGISINIGSTTDSFGNNVEGQKFYQKASMLDVSPQNRVNKKILYDSIVDGNYCVISAPDRVTIHSRDYLVKTLFEDLAAELLEGDERADYYSTIDLSYMFQRFIDTASSNLGAYLLFTAAIIDGALYSNPGGGNIAIGLNNEENMPIAPRAAVPCFAAVPIRYNRFVYGPWSTVPNLIQNTIFPSTSNPQVWSNNIVGGVEVEINPEYVPWNYNGMANLDAAVLNLLNDSNEYQQTEETGRITLAGIVLNNIAIGRRLLNSGPVCNSIVLTFGSDGIKTTYSFRTFSRKLGYFNKENADNIQRFAKQSRELRTQIVDNINSIAANTITSLTSSVPSYSAPKSMSFSPVSILVGAAYPFLHKQSNINNFVDDCKFDPGWPARPIIPNDVSTTSPKHISAVSLYDPAEMDRALFKDEESFAQKSVMSLDGIFSPVSLYPSAYHSTFALSKYRRSKCPMCQGSNTYKYLKINEVTLSTASNVNTMLNSDTEETLGRCPYCLPDSEIDQLKENGVQPSLVTPPFLIGSGTDREILSNRQELLQFRTSIINNYSYNPIVLATSGAEFSCSLYKQPNDFCGHSIDVVGLGNVIPRVNDSLRAAVSDNPVKNHNSLDVNADDSSRTQNYRFFGLRGPVILHSWGYDLDGYPVPNSSGEYQLDSNNNPITDPSGNPVGKNQTQRLDDTWTAPYKESTFMKGWAQQPASWPVGPIDFRWDNIGRVWTIGSNYKPVWVVIEHDMLDENPVRGIIVESSYNNDPLPDDLRKLVFVKDTMGMFSAPRGAALYCNYDSINGFYEPIYNRPLVTSGTIEGGRTATIYTAYTPSSVSEDIVSEYSTVFDNPLNLTINTNTIGLFIFLNGKWILQSSRG